MASGVDAKRDVEFGHSTSIASSIRRKIEIECPDTRSPLPTLLRVGYRVKLIVIIREITIWINIYLIISTFHYCYLKKTFTYKYDWYHKHCFHFKKKKKKNSNFLELEAELSGSSYSSDELSEDSTGSIAEFICDDSAVVEDDDMQAHYLKSVKWVFLFGFY